MSDAGIFASQLASDRAPARGHALFTRNLASTFNMIGLMLAGAWPETRLIRPRHPTGTADRTGR